MILALDVATKTGWAVRSLDGAVLSGVVSFASDSPHAGACGWRMMGWLADMLDEHGPSLVVIERPFASLRGPQLKQAGLVAVAQAICFAHDRGTVLVSAMTLKKFATGSGKAGKAAMVEAVRGWGYAPRDHNEADALAALHWAEATHGSNLRSAAA